MNETIPENFDNLASGEDAIRKLSKAAIVASDDLSLHALMIERAMNMLDYMAKRHVHSNEDELTVQMLAVRLLATRSTAVRLNRRKRRSMRSLGAEVSRRGGA